MFSLIPASRERAGQLLYRGEYRAAIRQYQRLLKRDPNDHELLNDLGVALLEADRVEEAIQCLQRANRIRENAIHLNNLGRAYLRQRAFRKAMATFEKARELDPEDPQPWFNLTVCLRVQGKRAEALAELHKFLVAFPSHPGARNDLALCFEAKGDRKMAVAHLHRALEADDGYTPARLNIVRILCDMGRIEDATHHMEALADDGHEVLLTEKNGSIAVAINGWEFYKGKAPK
jgi:Flp pilus assembly protein TadD